MVQRAHGCNMGEDIIKIADAVCELKRESEAIHFIQTFVQKANNKNASIALRWLLTKAEKIKDNELVQRTTLMILKCAPDLELYKKYAVDKTGEERWNILSTMWKLNGDAAEIFRYEKYLIYLNFL